MRRRSFRSIGSYWSRHWLLRILCYKIRFSVLIYIEFELLLGTDIRCYSIESTCQREKRTTKENMCIRMQTNLPSFIRQFNVSVFAWSCHLIFKQITELIGNIWLMSNVVGICVPSMDVSHEHNEIHSVQSRSSWYRPGKCFSVQFSRHFKSNDKHEVCIRCEYRGKLSLYLDHTK